MLLQMLQVTKTARGMMKSAFAYINLVVVQWAIDAVLRTFTVQLGRNVAASNVYI